MQVLAWAKCDSDVVPLTFGDELILPDQTLKIKDQCRALVSVTWRPVMLYCFEIRCTHYVPWKCDVVTGHRMRDRVSLMQGPFHESKECLSCL